MPDEPEQTTDLRGDPYDVGSETVFSGEVGHWREDEQLAAEDDPDDELLDETAENVVDVLGFDPLDEIEDEELEEL